MENTGFSEITKKRLNFTGPDFWYCEIAVTGLCNFNCQYCNRFSSEIDFDNICNFINKNKDTLKHVQLTGGEPTLYPKLPELCHFIKNKGIRLGISTNGTADYEYYTSLGIDIFYISLDDYDEDILIKRGFKYVEKIRDNISRLSKTNYVNVGIVVDSVNYLRIESIISYVLDLGIKDIRLSISTKNEVMPIFSDKDYSSYPTLNYRVNRFRQGKKMRGVQDYETFKCHLATNDISIVGNEHYPCLVYAREGGKSIGQLDPNVERDRQAWVRKHQPNLDPICKKYCMDFKCGFNKKCEQVKNGK